MLAYVITRCVIIHVIELQIATAKVSNVQGNAATITRLMFNSGSQRSYISNEIRSILNLTTLRKDRTTIKTFGNSYKR